MPYKSRRPCGYPGCPALVEAGTRYCPEHRKIYNRRDNSAHYDSRWRRISKLYLAAHPLCAECQRAGRLTPATETHHIIPVLAGGSDRDENLMGLCKSCHSRISLEEIRNGR